MSSTEGTAGVELVLLHEDDFMHPVEGAANFNESAYYNFFDRSGEFGGWVRIGNRPNEGYAEVTVCLYEPGGRVAFGWLRPRIEGNRAHDAGGLRFEVVEPWREHRITFDGRLCALSDPLAMADPSRAFRENPHEPATLEIRWLGLSPGWGGELRRRRADGDYEPATRGEAERLFARGHFEQHGAAEGAFSIGDRRYDLAGFGLRDHSWGPRYWQNTGYYRWLTLNFGDDLGLMGLVSERPESGESSRGYLYVKGQPNTEVSRVDLETEFATEQRVHARIRARFWLAAGGAPLEVEGRVLSLVPCRNRRGGWVTRISEGMTRWQLGDRTGTGMSEYLDHLVRGD